MKTQVRTPRAVAKRLSSPSVTIVVAPRERFSYVQPSIESIYNHTKLPFELIYIDIGSPQPVQRYLAQKAAEPDFTLLRTNRFLSPNQVRNLGLSRATTDYVLFIDNDIHVSPGWLERLWTCAQETDAAVVSPLICVGKPLHERILMAGGEVRIFLETDGGQTHRCIFQKHYLVNRSATIIKHQLQRRACSYAELHCMLVKREIFDQIGFLDEKLLSTREHIDFCLSVTQAGGKIYCEPDAVVSYVPETPRHWSDLTYFMLRWSDAWEVESLLHFQKKWHLNMDRDFMQRFRQLGHQRHQIVLLPLLRRLTIGHRIPWLEKISIGLERWCNQYITDRHRQLPTPFVER